jgi:hypothetical protein
MAHKTSGRSAPMHPAQFMAVPGLSVLVHVASASYLFAGFRIPLLLTGECFYNRIENPYADIYDKKRFLSFYFYLCAGFAEEETKKDRLNLKSGTEDKSREQQSQERESCNDERSCVSGSGGRMSII